MTTTADMYGKFMECLQCGYESDPVAEAKQDNRLLYTRTAGASKVAAA